MSSTGNSDIQRILADVMANRPYSHRQNVDPTVVAVVTVEEDMRFLPDTMGALLRQTVLPGVIVIADCAGGDNPPVQSQFQVIPAPSGLVSSVPQPKTVTVELVGVKGARSFYHGVAKALHDAHYEGWFIVEAEQDPAKANPLEYAKMAREYIKKTAGI